MVNQRLKPGAKAYSPGDFFPSLKPKLKPATVADHRMAAQMWAAAGYGRVATVDEESDDRDREPNGPAGPE